MPPKKSKKGGKKENINVPKLRSEIFALAQELAFIRERISDLRQRHDRHSEINALESISYGINKRMLSLHEKLFEHMKYPDAFSR